MGIMYLPISLFKRTKERKSFKLDLNQLNKGPMEKSGKNSSAKITVSWIRDADQIMGIFLCDK